MQKKRVTMKDIAQHTGLTVNSVSRALRDCDDISETTKKLVREMADKLGYVRDTLAESLRSGSTRTIAVIMGDIANPVFSLQIKSIERIANKADYSVIIYNTDENPRQERNAIMNAYSKRVDGILICPVGSDLDNVKLLEKIGIPYVLLGRRFAGFQADAVVWDEVKAGSIATQYLIERGHTNILYFGSPTNISSASERLEGYRMAHEQAGLPVNELLIHFVKSINSPCTKELSAFLRSGPPPFTAAVIFSDMMAFEVLYEFKRHGIRIPIVAFDNIQSKIRCSSPFPSVASQQTHGEVAMNLLFQKLHGEIEEPTEIVLDVFLANTAADAAHWDLG